MRGCGGDIRLLIDVARRRASSAVNAELPLLYWQVGRRNISRMEGWSSRWLRERIDSILFERSAISKQPEETIGHELEPGEA